MDIKLLEETGRALYGDQWQSNLARDLGINARTVRRWVNGDTPIPQWLKTECYRLLIENKKQIEEIINLLD